MDAHIGGFAANLVIVRLEELTEVLLVVVKLGELTMKAVISSISHQNIGKMVFTTLTELSVYF